MGKILGLDIGERKTGYAIADSDVPIAIPRGVIEEQRLDKLIAQIEQIIAEENIERLIIGIPYNLKGKVAYQAKKVLAFIKRLEKAIDIPIETVDERFTNRKSIVNDDSYAAADILQTWMNINIKHPEVEEK